ncbi:MAG: hypothetical protein ACTSU2_09945 [Promethearchaeota archaeon]
MGVKLGKLYGGNLINLKFLKGKIFAIDAYNIILALLKKDYKSFSEYNKNAKYNTNNQYIPVDKTQRAFMHLYGLFYRTISLIEHNIIPIYCFDGKPDPMKRLVTKDEINDFNFTYERYWKALKAGDYKKAKNIALGKEFLWKNSIRESRILLEAMGVPLVQAPSEGEAQCAEFVKKGVADFLISTDFDSFLFGSKNFIKLNRVNKNGISGKIYFLEKLLKNLEINWFQLIDLSILIGNDYFPGIKGVGTTEGIRILKNYGDLNNILELSDNLDELDVSVSEKNILRSIKDKLDFNLLQKIRKLFIFPEVIDPRRLNISFSAVKRAKIFDLMCRDHHLNEDKVTRGINRLIKAYKTI